MILLGAENEIIRHVLTSKFSVPGAVDQMFTDFDGVAYHIESSREGPLTLSMDIRCWPELVQYGARENLRQMYGGWIRETPEPDFQITLSFDLSLIHISEPTRHSAISRMPSSA